MDATSITWFWLCISLAHIRTLENTQTQFTILLCFQSLTLDDVGKRIIFIIFRQRVNSEEGAKSVNGAPVRKVIPRTLRIRPSAVAFGRLAVCRTITLTTQEVRGVRVTRIALGEIADALFVMIWNSFVIKIYICDVP